MLDKGETKVLLQYVINTLTCRKITPNILGELCDWIEESADLLGFDPLDSKSIGMVEGLRSIRDADKYEVGDQLTAYLKEFLPQYRAKLSRLKRSAESPLTKNLTVVRQKMGLSSEEQEVFGMIARYHRVRAVENFYDTLTRSPIKSEFVIAVMTGLSIDQVARVLQKNGRLFKLGLLKIGNRSSFNFLSNIEISNLTMNALFMAEGTIESFRKCIMGPPSEASLNWDDFKQLQPSADRLAVFLKKSCEMGLKGVNVLLHGPPGTGKTEFTKTIAEHLGMTLYPVGEVGEEGDEPTRSERLSSLRLAQNLLQEQKNCLLLFDEMDDLFESSFASLFSVSQSSSSKVFGNRLLENNPIPTLWTINNPELLDASILRRMSFAIEIKTPPIQARQEVWSRLLDKHGVIIQPEELRNLAEQDEVSPAIAENAVRFASLSGGNAEDIQFAAEGIVQVMSGHRPKKLARASSEKFLPELTSADIDLAYLTDRLANTPANRNFSLCLYGPSGTGKSAFGRHLADRMGMEVIYKRASDLLDMYVGNSEKNIARMFQQAREEDKLLILDEADSLLSDRSGAQRSWEVSQVNEMLTWMEDHPLPFICTTNLMDALDQASLRRFTFKVKFDYLTKKQVDAAFRHFFQQQPPADIGKLSHVTPGDFITVRRKSNLLGFLEDPARLTEMLEQEQQVKSAAKSMIGFA